MPRRSMKEILADDDLLRVVGALMFSATLPYHAFAMSVTLLIGWHVTKQMVMRVRGRAVEYLKRFQYDALREEIRKDATKQGAVVIRLGHDGTPLGVTVGAGSAARGAHRHNGEVFVCTAKVAVRGVAGACARTFRLPVDLCLLLKKKAGDIFPRLQRVLETIEAEVGAVDAATDRRALIVYNVQDSGGAARKLRKVFHSWAELSGRRYTRTAALTQWCGYHFCQLAYLDEVRDIISDSESQDYKEWAHTLYVFTRKLVYHRCDLLEEVEAFVRARFVNTETVGDAATWGLSFARGQLLDDDVSALVHLLGTGLQVASETGNHVPAEAALRFLPRQNKYVGHSVDHAVSLLMLILRKLQVGTESRWLSIGRSAAFLRLFDLLGGRILVAAKDDGFRKSVRQQWDGVIGCTLTAVGLVARPSDAALLEAAKRETLRPGETLRARVRELATIAYGEVREVLEKLGAISDHIDLQRTAAGVVRCAMNVENRLLQIDPDGVLFPLLDVVDENNRADAVRKFRNLKNLPPDWEQIQMLSEREIVEIAHTLSAVFTFGTRGEESQHAIASRKVGLHSHRRTIEGLSQEVLIPQFGKELAGVAAHFARMKNKRKQRCPQRASARSKFLGSYCEKQLAQAARANRQVLAPGWGQERRKLMAESFKIGCAKWDEEMTDEQKAAYAPNPKRRRQEDEFYSVPAAAPVPPVKVPEGTSRSREALIRRDAIAAAASSSSSFPVAAAAGAAVGPEDQTEQDREMQVDVGGARSVAPGLPELPIPISKLREYWTESDAEIARMRTTGCDVPPPWDHTPVHRAFLKAKWTPAASVSKFARRFLIAEKREGTRRLGALLLGFKAAAAGAESLLPVGDELNAANPPPTNMQLFLIAPVRGHRPEVSFLRLSLRVSEFASEIRGELPAASISRAVGVREVYKEFRNRPENFGDWYGKVDFDPVTRQFLFSWPSAVPVEELEATDPELDEECEAETDEDEEAEDEEILALRFAQEIREREMREFLENGGSGVSVAVWEKTDQQLLATGAEGASRVGAAARARTGKNKGARVGAARYRADGQYREGHEDVVARLAAARAQLSEVPSATALADGYTSRLNGGLWQRAHTRKGAAGHRSWMGDDGILVDRVIVNAPVDRHRAAGLQLSKGFDIHRHGGMQICQRLAAVWARAATAACEILEEKNPRADLSSEEAVRECIEQRAEVEAEYLEMALAEPDEEERKQAAGVENPLAVAMIQARGRASLKAEIYEPLAKFVHGKLLKK